MSKRRRDENRPDEATPETLDAGATSDKDSTKPDMGEGALLAALDQKEAEMKGEAAPKEKTEAKAEAAPVQKIRKVQYRVWAAMSPKKWDQLAGFQSHAKRLGLGPMTVPEWNVEFDKFMSKPVG